MENPLVKGLSVQIGRYEKQLLDSSINYSPSTLAQYLFSLGQTFNSFYQGVRVLDAPDEERGILLTLVKATMVVMQDGLDKLGIEVVEKM
jgi:arginyl-tRNA synthetase